MNLTELLTEVYTFTNRPDLVAESTSMIRAAVAKIHHAEYMFKDIQQGIITFDTANYENSFQTSNLVRFRNIAYIRKWNPTGLNLNTQQPSGLAGKFVKPRSIEDVLDAYKDPETEIYYIAGSSVNCKFHNQQQQLLVAWYAHPDISTAGLTNNPSWVCDEFPYAVVYEAAAGVFKMIGYDEQSVRYQNLADFERTTVYASNIEMEGR